MSDFYPGKQMTYRYCKGIWILLSIWILLCSSNFSWAEDIKEETQPGTSQSLYDKGVFIEQQNGFSGCAHAADWYLKAAESGHAEAQYRLASLYHGECSDIKDEAAARYWYMKAAEQGDVHAQVEAGLMYRHGWPNHDYKLAVQLFLQTAQQGNKRAQYELSAMYMYGIGVEQDEFLARKWLESVYDLQ